MANRFPLPLLDLARLEARHGAEIGGKAMGLARLMGWGYRVPDGAVVPVSAFRAAVAAAGAEEELARLMAEPAGSGFAGKAVLLQDLVLGLPLPGDLVGALGVAAGVLGPRLALRSSAASEDLPEASFAGQHESFLELDGAAGLVAKLKHAWASFFSARALAYRHRLGFEGEAIAPALVVQAMAEVRVAGVLFSRDPRGGRHRLLSAAPGLGEGIVSGAVEPDTWELSAADGAVESFRAGAKASRVVRAADGAGTARVEVAAHERGGPCLTPAEVGELARVARELEAKAGRAQDVEWAFGRDGLAILQARDATRGPGTVPPPPLRMAPEHVYSCGNLAETMGKPTRTLGLSLLQWMLDGGLRLPVFRALPAALRRLVPIFGRPYVDSTWLFVVPALGRLVLTQTQGIDSLATRELAGMIDRREVRARWPFGVIETLGTLGRLAWEALAFLPALVRAWSDPRGAKERLVEEVARVEAALERFRAGDGSAAEKLGRVVTAFPELTADEVRQAGALFTVWGSRMAELCVVLEGCVGRALGPALAFDLATPPEGTQTERMASALARLAALAGRTPEVRARVLGGDPAAALVELGRDPAAATFCRALEGFLAEFGHRGPGEQDLGAPRWEDEPAMLLPILAAQLDGPDPEVKRAEATRAREERLQELLAEVRAKAGAGRARRVAALVAAMREVFTVREDLKHYFFRLCRPLRRAYLEAGAELARRGLLERAGDVVELTREEVAAGLAGEAGGEPLARLARRRRAARVGLAAVAAPLVVLESGREVTPEAGFEVGDGGRVLRGEPASPGVLVGRVRVLADPSEGGRLGRGDVLVATATDPGWTTLFPVAGALVMEVGGVISHGAIVAREFGLPAVVGVPGATRLLRDGDLVRVDGARGTVRLLGS